MDHHYAGILDNVSLLGNPLDGSSVEMGSSNAVYECLEKDDGGDIRNAEENHMQIVNEAENGLYIDDGDHGVEGSRLKGKRRRGPRLWREKWQKMHPWAFTRNVDDKERMFCTVCEAHGHTTTRNAFRKEGSTNFQQSALATHANSSAHKIALGIQKARAEAGKTGTNGKARGKTVSGAEHGAVANHLINIANKLSSLVTREDLESLKAELRLMNLSESLYSFPCERNARMVNVSCFPVGCHLPNFNWNCLSGAAEKNRFVVRMRGVSMQLVLLLILSCLSLSLMEYIRTTCQTVLQSWLKFQMTMLIPSSWPMACQHTGI